MMLTHPSDYNELIEARIARAAILAKDYGFDVQCAPSFMKIVSDSSRASLFFRYDHIVLEEIAVLLSKRRRYHGSAILNVVIAVANQAYLRLELIAESPLRSSVLDLSQRSLQAWYRRHQFVDVDEHLMCRLPSSAFEQSPSRARRFPIYNSCVGAPSP